MVTTWVNPKIQELFDKWELDAAEVENEMVKQGWLPSDTIRQMLRGIPSRQDVLGFEQTVLDVKSLIKHLEDNFRTWEDQRDRLILALGKQANLMANLQGRVSDLELPPAPKVSWWKRLFTRKQKDSPHDCTVYAVPARASMRAVPPEG